MNRFPDSPTYISPQGDYDVPAYRHYRLDGAGGIVSAEWIEASNESEVVDLIRERKLPAPSEIWDGERLVARIDPAGP